VAEDVSRAGLRVVVAVVVSAPSSTADALVAFAGVTAEAEEAAVEAVAVMGKAGIAVVVRAEAVLLAVLVDCISVDSVRMRSRSEEEVE
jgi:hypothetical protein